TSEFNHALFVTSRKRGSRASTEALDPWIPGFPRNDGCLGETMKVSFIDTAHYRAPRRLPAEWPVTPDALDRDAGVQSYRGMVERVEFAESQGFDWVSVAEHLYSPHRLTPTPAVSAAHLAAHSQNIKIAVLGPIVSQSNPVQVAENLAMLDNLMPG